MVVVHSTHTAFSESNHKICSSLGPSVGGSVSPLVSHFTLNVTNSGSGFPHPLSYFKVIVCGFVTPSAIAWVSLSVYPSLYFSTYSSAWIVTATVYPSSSLLWTSPTLKLPSSKSYVSSTWFASALMQSTVTTFLSKSFTTLSAGFSGIVGTGGCGSDSHFTLNVTGTVEFTFQALFSYLKKICFAGWFSTKLWSAI